METLTDVESDVEAVFEELECIYGTMMSGHSGDSVAYIELHNCQHGFICQGHMNDYLTRYLPLVRERVRVWGCVRCSECDVRFPTVEDHHRVYPL